MKPEAPGALTIKRFCEWAGISRSMTYREIAAGRLIAVKCGKRCLIRFDDARAWLASLRRP